MTSESVLPWRPRFPVVADRLAVRRLAAPLAGVLTLAAIATFTGWFCFVVLARHAALRSNAADLGYYSQAAWNTGQGRPFRTTLMEDMVVRIPADVDPATLRDPGSLLAFHVEPVFLLIGQLYRLWWGPETLLIVQVAGAAAGAWAVHRVAGRSLRTVWAGPVFATAYLLAPPIHWALLSDFHPTVVGAGAVAFVFDFAISRPAGVTRPSWWGRVLRFFRTTDAGLFVAAVLALSAREDVALVVLPIALYRVARGPRRWAGVALAVAAAAWIAVCALLILPAYGSAGPSPYLYRYGHLGGDLGTIARTSLSDPLRVLALLVRPEASRFLAGTLAMTGGLWLIAPFAVLPALPIWAMNALSSWPWMAAGEAHYSILIMPPLFIATALGAARSSRWLGRARLPGRTIVSVWVLAGAILWTRGEGLTPLNPLYRSPAPTPHDRLIGRFTAQLPPDAAVSASTGIYPHVSSRERVYLYPTVRDAEYILVDVSRRSFPTTPPDQYFRLWSLVDRREFGIIDAADGYLLLRRHDGVFRFPEEFFTFIVTEQSAAGTALDPAGVGPAPLRLTWQTAYDGPDRVLKMTIDWVARSTLPDRQVPVVRVNLKGGVRDLAAVMPGLWWIQDVPIPPGRRLHTPLPPLHADQVRSIEIGPVGGPTWLVTLEGQATGTVEFSDTLNAFHE